MIDTDKYEGHAKGPWDYYDSGGLIDLDTNQYMVKILYNPYDDDVDDDGDDVRWEEVACVQPYVDRSMTTALLIADAPHLLQELKRAYQLIVDAAWQLHWNVGTIASSAHLSSKEWDEEVYAPAQAWRRQVQDILDASEEGCPWKESEGE